MPLQTLNNSVSLLEQRTKINAAIAALNGITNATAVTADGALSAGGLYANSTATNHTLSLVPGLGYALLVQGSTGTLTVTQGTASALAGAAATTATQAALLLIEVSAGAYLGIAFAPNNLGSASTHAATDFATAAQGLLAASALQSVSSEIISDATTLGKTLLTAASAASVKAALSIAASDVSGLGTAATHAATDFATAAQGALAATAVQPGSLGSAAGHAATDFDAAGAASSAQSASLQKASNLSDLASAATARANIGAAPATAIGVTGNLTLTSADAGKVFYNAGTADYTLTVPAGVSQITLVHGQTNALILAGSGGSTFTGPVATNAADRVIRLTEQAAGVYRGDCAPLTLTPRQLLPLFAPVGDSRIQNLTLDYPTNLVKAASNWIERLLQLTGYAGRIVYFGGVSGQRTDQYFGRLATAVATPNVTHIPLKGAVNNITQAPYTHAVSGLTISAANAGAQAFYDLQAMAQTALAAGKIVWIEAEEGIDSTWPASTWTAAMSTQMGIFNTLMEAWAQATPGVLWIKWDNLIMDRSSATNKHLVGVKYDGTHDTVGCGLYKAQYVLTQYPQALPPAQVTALNPASWTYTGTPAAPLQVLDNPGFTTKTGGTLASNGGITFTAWASGAVVAAGATRYNGANMYFTAAGGTTGATAPTHTTGTVSDGGVSWTYIAGFPLWASGQVVAANTYRINAGKLYATLAGGTTGATAPTHTTGSASDGGVAWVYVCPFGAWAATTTVAAKAFATNAGGLYYSSAGGTTGSTAPTHTVGTVSDGGVAWTYLMPVMSSCPQYWGTGVGSGGAIIAGTNNILNSQGTTIGVEMVMVALFSQVNGNAYLSTGSDYNAAFRGRQVVGTTYVLEASVQTDDHSNMGEVKLQWQRGDMTNPPTCGAGSTLLWTDGQSRYANGLGAYPILEQKRTQPLDCQAQGTANGNTLGTVATWNDVRIQATGAGAGMAIVRARNVKMYPSAT